MSVTFEIPGRPVAKERARTMKGYTYTPPRTRAYEETVALLARTAGQQFDGPVRVSMTVSPDGVFVTVEDFETQSKLRGDIDNYAKCVLDGMVKGGLIKDDIHIMALDVVKL